jgi:hypothetical protein
MADRSSRDGGGGLGWLIIGLLIGIAGTLATQKFAVFRSNDAAPDVTTATLQPTAPAALPGPGPKLIVHQGGLSQPPAAAEAQIVPREPVQTRETPAEVADDAAATGMTARAKPQSPPN